MILHKSLRHDNEMLQWYCQVIVIPLSSMKVKVLLTMVVVFNCLTVFHWFTEKVNGIKHKKQLQSEIFPASGQYFFSITFQHTLKKRREITLDVKISNLLKFIGASISEDWEDLYLH